jgi:hypothetical protein
MAKQPHSPLPQMDRFIPNRSASNLDVANYNVSREAKDVENVDAMSPTKVRNPAGFTETASDAQRMSWQRASNQSCKLSA